ncbi:MAG: hypothetical protein K0R14_601 [Burkholderiales bacterium]|nr:hypothetical protein [Burkholderiales bacterium]
MKLLCHRGWWREIKDQNSIDAFRLALTHGYGIETDVRDLNGELVISHDLPKMPTKISFDSFLNLYSESREKPLLALNIKSDGLQKILMAKLAKYAVTNYFVFDMSIPDTLGYMKLNMPYAARLSEYETELGLAESSPYIWLDAFVSEWYDIDLISQLLEDSKTVIVVSPELHKRQHKTLWNELKLVEKSANLYLCTDLIDEAMGELYVTKD